MEQENQEIERALLISDLEHFGESLWRNEEIGEKRFNFFLGLVTAVIAGLVALHTAEQGKGLRAELLSNITFGALFGLLLIGILTYLRMLQRNRVTDQYQHTLKYIRKRLGKSLTKYEVPVIAKPGYWKWLKGGLAEMVGAINAAIIGVIFVLWGLGYGWSALLGLIFFIPFWWFASRRNYQWIDKSIPGQYFRAGAGAVIVNREGLVLAFERSGQPGSWQFPQGGLDAGEKPVNGAYREVAEETGIARKYLKLIDQYPEPLLYELPARAQTKKTGRGQAHYWFFFELEGEDKLINVVKGREFHSWKWISFDELADSVVEFRKPVYKRLADYFRENILKGLAADAK